MGFFWGNNDTDNSNNKENRDISSFYTPKYQVGQRVMIKWRGQVGDIIDFDSRSGLYLVKTTGPDGFADTYHEDDLYTNF